VRNGGAFLFGLSLVLPMAWQTAQFCRGDGAAAYSGILSLRFGAEQHHGQKSKQQPHEPFLLPFCELARRKGFEPLTPRFEVWCSIQLSYRRQCVYGRISRTSTTYRLNFAVQ